MIPQWRPCATRSIHSARKRFHSVPHNQSSPQTVESIATIYAGRISQVGGEENSLPDTVHNPAFPPDTPSFKRDHARTRYFHRRVRRA